LSFSTVCENTRYNTKLKLKDNQLGKDEKLAKEASVANTYNTKLKVAGNQLAKEASVANDIRRR
jgi:hypothetical protein